MENEMKIQTVSNLSKNEGIKVMLYGPPKSGKTYSISTLPDHDKTLILAPEKGVKTLRKIAPNMPVISIDNMGIMRQAYEFLLSDEGLKYENIILDSLSDIANKVVKSELQKTSSAGKKVNGMAAYGELQMKIESLFHSFNDLKNRNVIFICRQEKIQDEECRLYYGPLFPGKALGLTLPYEIDYLTCLRTKKNDDGTIERVFQFTSLDDQYLTGQRGDDLDDFEPPNWEVIFDKINKGYAPEKDTK